MRVYANQPSGTVDRARTLRRDMTKAERLVIEVDGDQHADAAAYDAARTRFMESEDYRVLRFGNHDVLTILQGVLEGVAQRLAPSPSRGSAAHPSPGGRGREQPQAVEGRG